jgi:predicted O-linked N-acetylglucosamine transferase (SPINDLY family)
MRDNRLLAFAGRPAPIQVTAWGEPAGTGLKTMDYLLADPVLVHASERPLLAERVFDLPNFLGYWQPDAVPEPAPLPALARGYVTFGSFNRPNKIQDPVLRRWAAILRALPTARLVLKSAGPSADVSHPIRIRPVLESESIGSERVTLLGRTRRLEHFAAYHDIDIALDPFPHGGGMTTLDALWMGVPVVTWRGGTIASRLAAASLTALDLADFIAPDAESYVALAVAKARDLKGLAETRATLRERMARSAFGDPTLYARAVEAAYAEMWRTWCAGKDRTTARR